MELRHLRYFLAVATAGTFRGAAQRLGISQPALSNQVRDLEKEIGANLFLRRVDGVQLTAAGRVLEEEAKAIMISVEEAVRKAKKAKQGRGGSLRVGAVGALVLNIFPQVLTNFKNRYPEVEIKLCELSGYKQLDALASGTIDIALTAWAPEMLPRWVGSKVVLDQRLLVGMAAEHPLVRRHKLSLASLSETTLLACAHDCVYSGRADQITELFAQFNLPVPKIRTVEDYESLVALLLKGQGVVLVPELSTAMLSREVVLRPLKGSSGRLNASIQAIWNAAAVESIGRGFLEVVERTLAQAKTTSSRLRSSGYSS